MAQPKLIVEGDVTFEAPEQRDGAYTVKYKGAIVGALWHRSDIEVSIKTFRDRELLRRMRMVLRDCQEHGKPWAFVDRRSNHWVYYDSEQFKGVAERVVRTYGGSTL